METLAQVAGKSGNSGKYHEISRTACREKPGNPGNPPYTGGFLPASHIPLFRREERNLLFSRLLQSEFHGTKRLNRKKGR
jgi:hypothetical protein